jgi:hypothetical protein
MNGRRRVARYLRVSRSKQDVALQDDETAELSVGDEYQPRMRVPSLDATATGYPPPEGTSLGRVVTVPSGATRQLSTS